MVENKGSAWSGPRLEGSRFGMWLNKLALFAWARVWPKILAAGGSRKRPSATFCPPRLVGAADRATKPGDVRGSRLLPSDRAAIP
jgi:hypothetical protein